ncbi:MAG: helix-turn-helix domain-containing protein [Acidobacteriaceae bacterium]|nr:helix-turn-helix domain-containing protein [Acidobacteriaceae bacterium]
MRLEYPVGATLQSAVQNSTQDPGQKLRRLRERLRLRYRDVAEASQRIASQRANHEFAVGLSRLADIENKGTVPSLYRLYSLCAIYSLDFNTALNWYGINLQDLVADSAKLALAETHPVDFTTPDEAQVDLPMRLENGGDLKRTSYLSRHIQQWGKMPLLFLNSVDFRKQRYAFLGTNDWSMHPIIPPGSFLQIDESKRRVIDEGWVHEYERPIYFLEHRNGYRCGWCTQSGNLLIVQPHSASHEAPAIFKYPGEVDVLGQVVGVAMRLDLGKRRHTRF